MTTPHLADLAQTLFEDSGDALFLFEPDGERLLDANPAARRAAELPPDGLPPHTLADLFAAETPDGLTPLRRAVRAAERLPAADGFLLRRGSQPPLPVQLSAAPSGGLRLAILVRARAEHALEEQFRQAQKMEAVSQLAGGIAHDFNNLLTAITGNLALLKAGLSAGNPGRGQAETAERAAWRAAALTRQLLCFSRRTRLRPEPASLNHMVDEVLSLIGHSLDPRIAVEVRQAADLWLVAADLGQMKQVLMNLCLNARDALLPLLDGAGETVSDWDHGADHVPTRRPACGRLLLETANVTLGEADAGRRVDARPGDHVRLRVCDNGMGIPPELLPRIFEPFFTTKGPDRGTGLGLAMTFGIVQQHGGWVDCRSAPDWGTCFDVHLPRHPAADGRETILLQQVGPASRAGPVAPAAQHAAPGATGAARLAAPTP